MFGTSAVYATPGTLLMDWNTSAVSAICGTQPGTHERTHFDTGRPAALSASTSATFVPTSTGARLVLQAVARPDLHDAHPGREWRAAHVMSTRITPGCTSSPSRQ